MIFKKLMLCMSQAGSAGSGGGGGGGDLSTITTENGVATPVANNINFLSNLLPNANPSGRTVRTEAFGDDMGLTFYNNNNIIINAEGYNAVSSGGDSNTGLGSGALSLVESGGLNVGIGRLALNQVNSDFNVGVGGGAGQNITTGQRNLLLGQAAGNSLSGSDSFNIMLLNNGLSGDNGVIRIGTSGTQTTAYMAGVASVVTANSEMVTIDTTTGQLGSATIPSGGSITLTTDNGIATPASSNINLLSHPGGTNPTGQTILFSASSDTITFETTDANSNIALGFGAGTNLDLAGGATGNTLVGYQAGAVLTTGVVNDAFGYQSLAALSTGNFNTAIGTGVGSVYNGSESSNLLIGGGGSQGVVGENNTLRIGKTGTGSFQQSRCFIAGSYGVTTDSATTSALLISDQGQLGTISSSARYKDNIQDMEDTFLMKLRPVNFSYKTDASKRKQYGLVAEEVYAVMPEIVNLDEEGRPDNVRYHDMPAILLHEMQKMNERIKELEKKLGACCE